MLRSVRLRIYVYANLNVRYIDYLTRYGKFASALLTMLKFSIRKRVRILDS